MMRTFVIVLILGTTLFAFAKDETIEELKEHAASAETKKQPELYAKLAAKQLEAANDAYNANPEQARSLVQDATDSAEKAAKASVQSGKREKKTEIDLRKLENRMEDVIRTWAFEDRSVVKPFLDRIETARNSLLNRMFQK
jgi:ABC-type nitrate/sulfonate/bicarbonate transport system substrate-binding protein